jgi:hypothetical protein
LQLLIRAQLPIPEGGLGRKSVMNVCLIYDNVNRNSEISCQVYICTEGEAPTKRLKQMADHLAAGNLTYLQFHSQLHCMLLHDLAGRINFGRSKTHFSVLHSSVVHAASINILLVNFSVVPTYSD